VLKQPFINASRPGLHSDPEAQHAGKACYGFFRFFRNAREPQKHRAPQNAALKAVKKAQPLALLRYTRACLPSSAPNPIPQQRTLLCRIWQKITIFYGSNEPLFFEEKLFLG